MSEGPSKPPLSLMSQNTVPDLLPTQSGPNWRLIVNALLTSSEVRNFKRELKSLLEDPHEVADQLNQFLGPQIYTWVELMSIVEILVSGEERIMTRRVTMAIWEREHPTPGWELTISS
jgi:hypothetical protein